LIKALKINLAKQFKQSNWTFKEKRKKKNNYRKEGLNKGVWETKKKNRIKFVKDKRNRDWRLNKRGRKNSNNREYKSKIK
jgi:hypothetical protein